MALDHDQFLGQESTDHAAILSKPESKDRAAVFSQQEFQEGPIVGNNVQQSWPEYVQKSNESSVRCIGSKSNQSCYFNNLYWWEGRFHLLARKGNINIRGGIKVSLYDEGEGIYVQPELIEFEDLLQLEAFLSSMRLTTWHGLTVAMRSTDRHLIHMLFDGLYPVFVALCRFGLQGQPFHTFILNDLMDPRRPKLIKSWAKPVVDEILQKFGGLSVHVLGEVRTIVRKLYPYGTFKQTSWSHNLSVHMERAVIGNCLLGNRVATADLSLPGGRSLDASRLFRDRMHLSFEVNFQTIASTKRGIIIDNFRYSHQEQIMLRKIMKVKGFRFDYINWRDYGTSLKTQLQMLQSVGIHVSSCGSAQMYQTFLSDGSVHVNLGCIHKKGFTEFMEQYQTEGAPYLRALYYDSSKRRCGLEEEEVKSLLERAVSMFRQTDISFPTPPLANLSPEGQVFVKMCRESQDNCKQMLHAMNMRVPDSCGAAAWAEHVVYEAKPAWSPCHGRPAGCAVKGHCPFPESDREHLHLLREAAGLDRHVLCPNVSNVG